MEHEGDSSDESSRWSEDGIVPAEPTNISIATAVREILDTEEQLTCRRLSEGTDHAVYAVGDQYIARCYPATENSKLSLQRDAAVQTLARKYFRNPGIVPEVIHIISVEGWQGNLERQIHGVSLEETAPTEKTLDDLARLLTDLDSIPVPEGVEATAYQREKVNLKARVPKAIRAWEDLVQKGFAIDAEGGMAKVLKDKLHRLSQLTPEPYRPVLVHGDINTENILIDREDGSIVGVIDWSDALVGDPCTDVAGVIFAVGVERARRVAVKAGLSEGAFGRGLLYCMTVMVRDLRETLCEEEGQGESKEHLKGLLRDEYRRVFEGTGLEKALG